VDSCKIIAELTFYPRENVKEKRKYFSKYRPMFKIREDMYNDGQIVFIEDKDVFSGDKGVKAYITFAYGHLVSEYLKEGKTFTFGEGHKVLGEGTVLSIL
jgi:hypothetical protein